MASAKPGAGAGASAGADEAAWRAVLAGRPAPYESPPSSPPYIESSSPVAAGGGDFIAPGAPRKQFGCLALKGTYVFGEIDGEKQKLVKMDFFNVLAIFQKLSMEGDGCTIEQVTACAAELPSSNHMSKEKILIIIKELELDGHIYSTLNDSTFKTTGPLAQPAEPAPHVEEGLGDEEAEDKGGQAEAEDEDDQAEAEDEEDEEDLMQRIKKLSQENAALKKQRDELMQAHVEKNKWFSKLLKGFKKFKEVVAVAAEDAKEDYDTSDDADEEEEERPQKHRRRS